MQAHCAGVGAGTVALTAQAGRKRGLVTGREGSVLFSMWGISVDFSLNEK